MDEPMSEKISYDQMRRILGLPDLRTRAPAPWAVRKIRDGHQTGRWGVWRRNNSDAQKYLLVEGFDSWADAMSRAGPVAEVADEHR